MFRMKGRERQDASSAVSSDGERIRLEDDPDREDWARLSARALEDAYGDDEPEYSLDLIKRPNPEYEGR